MARHRVEDPPWLSWLPTVAIYAGKLTGAALHISGIKEPFNKAPNQARKSMPQVNEIVRTWLHAVTGALVIGLFTPMLATAHTTGSAKLVKLQPEVAYTFTYDDAVYEVYNSHLINFAGLERIEIRTLEGEVAKVWWSRRGWCFTQNAYAAAECMSQERYDNFFAQKLAADAISIRINTGSGGGRRSSALDGYPCLEKRLSSNQASTEELTAPDC